MRGAEQNVHALLEDLPLVLIVDDEIFRTRLCRAFAQRKWEAEAAPDAERAATFASERSPDLVLVDLRMPGKGGLELIQELRAIDPSMTIIMLTPAMAVFPLPFPP